LCVSIISPAWCCCYRCAVVGFDGVFVLGFSCVRQVLRRTRKPGPNHGRMFYSCASSNRRGCSFFQWQDEGSAALCQRSSEKNPLCLCGCESGRCMDVGRVASAWAGCECARMYVHTELCSRFWLARSNLCARCSSPPSAEAQREQRPWFPLLSAATLTPMQILSVGGRALLEGRTYLLITRAQFAVIVD
jgi:GRF zinc finger